MARRLPTLLAICALHGVAAAQEPLVDNDFEVDLVATPATGSSRIIGLAGATTALAEGVGSVASNAAGYASRYSWELDWWEYEIDASLQFPGAFASADYFLNGQGRALGVDEFLAFEVAGRLQLGNLGFGTLVRVEDYRLRADSASSVSVSTTRLGAGYSFASGQLVVGAGIRIISFDLFANDARENLVDFNTVGAEFGFVLKPENTRWRLGGALRSSLRAQVSDESVQQAAGFWIPRSVNLPWEFTVGFAWQWLERPFNLGFRARKNVRRSLRARLQETWCARERLQRMHEEARNETGAPHTPQNSRVLVECGAPSPSSARWWGQELSRREAELDELGEEAQRQQEEMEALQRAIHDTRPRRYVLLSADALLLGPTGGGNAIGIDAFVRQERFRRGERVTFGFRVGAETEIVPHLLKLRAGSYVEQARYAGVRSRVHGTFGFDLRVFRLFGIDWRLSASIDGARQYVNWGISVGTWH